MNTPILPLLTFNCHEAWVHQLEYLEYPFDIIDELPGRYCRQWDLRVRPFPRNSTLVTLDRVLESRPSYLCIIAHNITDLLDSKALPGPRILVIHSTLNGRMRQHGLEMEPEQLRVLIRMYLEWVGGHAVAVSPLKGNTWGLAEDVVEFSVDVGQYFPWSGEVPAGLRISNQIRNRREILHWEFHQAAFHDIQVRLVGFNPDLPGVAPSENWEGLKSLLASHRFYIHTAHPELEDGYNMATLEAMAAGLPVLGNCHPSSPVEHGISGFLTDDPRELKKYATLLLQNRELAGRMGEAARKRVAERFSHEKFAPRFQGSIARALRRWQEKKAPEAYFTPEESSPGKKEELLARSGRFLRLSGNFRDLLGEMEVDKALKVLNEMTALMGMKPEKEISSFNDLVKIVIGLNDRLKRVGDNQSVSILLNSLLAFIPS